MEQSARLALSYVAPQQAQKHVTVNETFRRLDQLVQQSVLSRTTAPEPASPNEGDAYILTAIPTGAVWGNYSQHNIAVYQDGAWTEIVPAEGFHAWVADDDEFIIYDGASWAVLSGGSSESAAIFGVNTTADTTNRLAVKSDAILFTHDDVTPGNDDCQVKINKKAAADTGSLLFQTGAAGRAEFGLAGDDDFHVKVSANGSTWNEAILIDKDDAEVRVPEKLVVGASASVGAAADIIEVHGTGPRIVTFDTDSTGVTALGFVSFNDSAAAQMGFIGFGSTSTVNLQLYNIETGGDLYFYTEGALRGRFDSAGGFVVGTPTGAAKGAGTINAQAVYDDNALLSCYVFDQAIDGDVSIADWDNKVPDRIIPDELTYDRKGKEITRPGRTEARTHEPMRKFLARVGTPEDPLTLDGYAKHWKEKRHLTAMPNEATFDPVGGQLTTGEWIQRLVETVEIQAVLIEELNQRTKSGASGDGVMKGRTIQ